MLYDKLNALLANYEVMYHKLQTFHWYVCGPTFFADHAQLEELYGQVAQAIDAVAETTLMAGGNPLPGMRDWLGAATIGEAKAEPIAPQDAYAQVLDDYKTLLAGAVEVKEQAEKDKSHLVAAFADDLIAELSKSVWMLSSAMA